MGTAEIVDIARSVWKAIIIIVLAFAALNFLIQALLRWEKTYASGWQCGSTSRSLHERFEAGYMITRCNSESLSVYVHFPFCKRKCTYCDFASYEGMEHRIPTYMEALKKEIIEKSAEFEKRKIYTVYFGGGTPTYPDSGWIQKIMNLLKESFDCSFCEESTLEANPGTVTPESLKKYKEAGFNRLSIGLQSANDRELEKAGRIHRYRDFLESYQYARNAGFTNRSKSALQRITKEG
jgi:coproporphyrinogen III oxidase-like Fe-S oxidoreductase